MVVTMSDVAKRAKVGIGTVSRVVNNSARVREVTRQRVLAAVNELGYRQTRIARALAHEGSYAPTVGILSPQFSIRSQQLLMVGIHHAATTLGYHLLLNCPPPGADLTVAVQRAIRQFHVDGMLLLTDMGKVTASVRQLIGPLMPVVSAGRHLVDIPSVYTDDYRGGQLAAEHLWERGCRRPAIITLPKFPARRAAFTDFFHERGVTDLAQRTVEIIEYSEKESYDLTEQLLAQEPDGFFYCSDVLAVGGLAKIRSTGRKLPVIGYDNLDFAGPMGLTTVDQRLESTGRISLEMLALQINGHRGPGANEVENRVLTPAVVVRET